MNLMEKDMIDLYGVFPPIIVPFTESGQIDFTGFRNNLISWGKTDLRGVVFPGSNSEFPYLTEDEKIKLWEICIESMKSVGKLVIAGTGMESTSETIRLTKIAYKLGVDATLVIPPCFYKAEMKHNILLNHYLEVADASSVPLLIYNVPSFSGIDIQADTIIKLADHPNIIGMKDSSSNVVKTSMILSEKPDFKVFCGSGGSLLPFLSIGAVGGIMALANFASLPLIDLYNSFNNHDLERAKKLQHLLVKINDAVTSKFGIPGLKYAMTQCGYQGGYPRRPLLPVDQNIKTCIDELLRKLDL